MVTSPSSSSVVDEYLGILDLAYDVAHSLNGTVPTDPKMRDCQQLAIKLFFHATSVYWLRQGTKAPVTEVQGGAFFFDFPSVTVLARAALETYLTMFEVFFEHGSDDEREFRYQLWLLSGFSVRERHIPTDPPLKSRVKKSQLELDEMRKAIKATSKFKDLSKGLRKSVLKGRRLQRDWTHVARAAGFGEKLLRTMWAYYSGYVHADGLSGAQIIDAKTKEDQIEHIETQMRTILMSLSKMILNYVDTFPLAKAAAESKPEFLYRAEIWSGAAALMD
jgi:hypothetical protein